MTHYTVPPSRKPAFLIKTQKNIQKNGTPVHKRNVHKKLIYILQKNSIKRYKIFNTKMAIYA